ncbi:integration host factor subunit alpha [bacterium]|nr:integration host factor subunit alpha [bacterium]
MADKTLTRADIVERLHEVTNLPRQECQMILEDVLETVCAELERDQDVKLAKFGNFVVRKKNQRIGRNPKTGEEASISARRVVTFKPSPVLRNRIETAHQGGGRA